MTSLTSLLHRLTHWTSVGSHISSSSHKNHHPLQDVEKAERGERAPSSRPESTPAARPVPRMDLVIPDIEDTVMGTVVDAQDKSWDGHESHVPVIIVSKVRAESGDYRNTWNIAKEEDTDNGPSHT